MHFDVLKTLTFGISFFKKKGVVFIEFNLLKWH